MRRTVELRASGQRSRCDATSNCRKLIRHSPLPSTRSSAESQPDRCPRGSIDADGHISRLSVPRIDRDCFVLFPRLSEILNVSAVPRQQAPIPDTANSG